MNILLHKTHLNFIIFIVLTPNFLRSLPFFMLPFCCLPTYRSFTSWSWVFIISIPWNTMLNTHKKMAVIFKQRLKASSEINSQVFGHHYSAKTKWFLFRTYIWIKIHSKCWIPDFLSSLGTSLPKFWELDTFGECSTLKY